MLLLFKAEAPQECQYHIAGHDLCEACDLTPLPLEPPKEDLLGVTVIDDPRLGAHVGLGDIEQQLCQLDVAHLFLLRVGDHGIVVRAQTNVYLV